jgi:VanZ family protein
MRILVAVAYVGLIFTLSTWSHPPSGPEVAHLDKLVHTVEYGILGLLIWWASAGRARGWRGLALLLAIGLMVAITDEMIQRRTPGRDSSGYDFLADGVGLCLAWVARCGRGPSVLDSRAPEGHD